MAIMILTLRHGYTNQSVTQTSQLILYREIIAICSEIHTKHINTLCGQNVELLNVKLVVHIVTIGL
jgi:proteasome assembly chaperone (PAC2) family protein